MKTRANWLLIPAVALGLGACNKKEEAKAPDAPKTVAEVIKEAIAPVIPAVPKLSTEQRAAKLGFAKHLPQDTQVVLSFQNGSKTTQKFMSSNLWKMIDQEINGASSEEAAAPEAAAEELTGPAALFGEEFTLAMGKPIGDQLGNVLTLNRRSSYFQMRSMARAFAAAMKSGKMEDFASSMTSQYSAEMMSDIAKDPQSGISLLEKLSMPPIYLSFKTKESNREEATQQISGMLAMAGMLGEMVQPVEFESSGYKFSGTKILGAKLSEMLAAGRADMEKNLDAASVDRIISALAKRDIIIASGTVGDYAVAVIGGSIEELKLASDPAKSLVATEALGFTDAYHSKELAALVYGDKPFLDTALATAGGIGEIMNGLRDGLAGAEGLGDTRDLEAMFQIVSEREAALRKLAGTDAYGMVGFFEEGLKIESYGGVDSGVIDTKTPNKLAHLGKSEDVVLFANMTTDAAYHAKTRAYAESVVETAYAITMRIVDSPLEGEEIDQFKQGAKLFDTKFRTDALALWDALSNDFSGSLGMESAWVIDLNGAAPAIPGLPQAVVDKAKIPRISVISPVTDRAKLSASWEKMNTTATSSLAKICELTGQNIPMQKPMSTEKSGATTWFFPMPLFTDDFLPSVTVSDKWFVASTSKNQALDLITKAEAGGETQLGFHLNVNFKALEKYSKETFKIIEENAEAISGKPLEEDAKKAMKASLTVMSALDHLDIHSRHEGSVQRGSIHFKTR